MDIERQKTPLDIHFAGTLLMSELLSDGQIK
jgi:hypothetical protein